MDFRLAAEPLGISSFASDEELRTAGVAPVAVSQAMSATPSVAASQAHGAAHGDSSNGPSVQIMSTEPMTAIAPAKPMDTLEVVTTRAAQRKVIQQQQTIRMLMVAVFVLASMVIVGLAAWLGASKNSTARQGNAPLIEKHSGAPPDTTTAPEQQPQSSTSLENDANTPEETAEITPPVDTSRAQGDFNRAQELIAVAEDSSRPRPDRIRDYEEALELLKRIQMLPADSVPEDLPAITARVEREIERLKLEEFFP
jgi:hypothetical protein